MMNGPRKPPRLPTALMNAIPAAAPSSRRNAVGSDQNGGVNAYSPTAAIDSDAKRAAVGNAEDDATANPAAAKHADAAACQRRSPVRSECVATTTMPTAAIRNGTAVHAPTARSEARENALTICGRKKLNP